MLIATVLAIGSATVLAFVRWWQAVRWILVLLVLEGGIRKWLLPEQQQLVYLAKDFLLVGVYLGFLTSRRQVRRVRIPLGLIVVLVGCAAWGALEVFNSRLPTLLVGILGWKAYFWYVPLLWVVPAAFRDLQFLEKYLRQYLLFAIPMAVLAFAQFRAPASSALNRYAWGESAGGVEQVATFGEAAAARVTGTFSYITGFSTFLVVIAIIAVVVLGLHRFRLRGQSLIWSSLLTVPIGVLLSGSRSPLLLLGGLLPLFFLFSRREAGERARAIVSLAMAGAIGAALISYAALPALEAFSYRVRTADEELLTRVVGPFVEPIRVAPEVGLLGYGIGATHQAAASLVPQIRPGSWLEGLEAEVESTRIMIELGPLGFVLHYGYRIGIVLFAFGVARRARMASCRVIALGAAFFLLAQLPGAIVFNVYAGLYFWFFAGVVLLVRAVERESALLSAASAPSAPAWPARLARRSA